MSPDRPRPIFSGLFNNAVVVLPSLKPLVPHSPIKVFTIFYYISNILTQ